MSKSAASTDRRAGWLPVSSVKPYCPRSLDALGTPVLIWPRLNTDGFAYYGKRATGHHATFYLHGAVLEGVTHWQPMPKGPNRGC